MFVVLHADDGEHWRLKANVPLLAAAIEEYIEDFDPGGLIPYFIRSTETLADLIWITDDGAGRVKVEQRAWVDEAWAKFRHTYLVVN